MKKDSASFETYYTKALRFLTIRPRSEKEVRDNLLRKKAPLETVQKVVEQLKEQKYLNDREFVKWWIEQRTEFRPRSLRLIKLELKQKGIPDNVIELGIKNKELREEKTDLESAKKIIRSRIHRFKGLSRFELIQKLGPQLARKGFSYDTIKQAIDLDSIGVDENEKEGYNTD